MLDSIAWLVAFVAVVLAWLGPGLLVPSAGSVPLRRQRPWSSALRARWSRPGGAEPSHQPPMSLAGSRRPVRGASSTGAG